MHVVHSVDFRSVLVLGKHTLTFKVHCIAHKLLAISAVNVILC